MTGAVSWEALTWIIGIITVAGGAVAGLLFVVYGIIKSLKTDFEEKLDAMNLRIEAVDQRNQLINKGLADNFTSYRQHVGETFATKEGVTQAVERVERAIEILTGRIDRVLEQRIEPARRST